MINRRIQGSNKLKKFINTGILREAKIISLCFVSLSLIPKQSVNKCFDTLVESDYVLEHNDMFESFIDYFRKQFIGEKVAQRHRTHEMKIYFNHHTSVKKDGLKTTSSLESSHKKFASLVGSPEPFI